MRGITLAGTYDGSKILLYVNGVQVATTSYSGGIGIPSSFDNIIGGLSNAPATLDFGGYISNIQIYDTSLDAGEVQSMYAEGIGGRRKRFRTSSAGGRSTGT